MSLEKVVNKNVHQKFSALILAGALGCGPEEGKTYNHYILLDEVGIYEATTDSEGKVSFHEQATGEDVVVSIFPPMPDVSVLYFDNHDSEGFMISHPYFTPQLNIAAHNSSHEYSLTSSFLQIFHDSFKKERSKPGAEKFISWSAAGWKNTACYDKEEFLALTKPGMYLLKYLGIISTLGITNEYLDDFEDEIEDLPDSTVVDAYVFISADHGFRTPTTSITALDFHVDGKCNYQNQE